MITRSLELGLINVLPMFSMKECFITKSGHTKTTFKLLVLSEKSAKILRILNPKTQKTSRVQYLWWKVASVARSEKETKRKIKKIKREKREKSERWGEVGEVWGECERIKWSTREVFVGTLSWTYLCFDVCFGIFYIFI